MHRITNIRYLKEQKKPKNICLIVLGKFVQVERNNHLLQHFRKILSAR